MAGRIGWRLLIAFSLVLVVSVLRGQEVEVARPDGFAPGATVRSSGEPRTFAPKPVTSPIFPSIFHLRGNPPLHLVPRMVAASGIIFSGYVVSVARTDAVPGQEAAPTVITFQVQHAIRGVIAGQKLTIREWPGLWNRGERYRVGERVFLFLYPPSRLGLTSPVAGSLGRLAMDAGDRILVRPEAASAFAPDIPLEGRTVVPYADFQQALQPIGYAK